MINNFAVLRQRAWCTLWERHSRCSENLFPKNRLFKEKWFFFRILSFFRWLDDNLSAGLLQQHITFPEAHFENLLYLEFLHVFFGLRKFFSECCQKTSGRIVNFTYTEENLHETVSVFSEIFFLNNVLRLWEDKLQEPWRKMLAGSSIFLSNVQRKYLKENLLRKSFEFSKKPKIWPKTSLELRKLTQNLGKFGKTACHVSRGCFWGSFFGKNCFLTLFGFWGAM